MLCGIGRNRETIKSEIEIFNGSKLILSKRDYIGKDEVNHVKTKANFTAGKFRLAITEKICNKLDLQIIGKRIFISANDEVSFEDVAEFVEISLENRRATVEPFVLRNIPTVTFGINLLNELNLKPNLEQTNLIVSEKPRRI